VDVHGAGGSEIIVSPNLVQKHVPGKNPTLVIQEMLQQLEFFGREGVDLPFIGDLVLGQIQGNPSIFVPNFFGPGLLQTPEKSLDPRDHFPRAEGLGDIIIRANFQAHDAIGFLRLGRDHNHRDFCGRKLGTQASADFQPVHLREHEVQEDQIKLFLGQFPQAGIPIFDSLHFISFPLQIMLEKVLDILFVLDNQYFFGHSFILAQGSLKDQPDLESRRRAKNIAPISSPGLCN
jgi:hypothetical protein